MAANVGMISMDYKVKFQDCGKFTLREIEATDQDAPGALKNKVHGGNLWIPEGGLYFQR